MMPISSFEGLQPLLGYYPHGPESGGYDWWHVGSTEQEHGPQPGPDFNSHTPRVGHDSWPIPSLEGVQCLPHYYDSRSHDPFHAGCDATPISRQEYHPQPNAGYSWVPDSRALHCVVQGVQFYPDPYVPPFQDDRLTSFAYQGSRFHPNSPPYFPQGVDDASRPLSTIEQEQGLQPHHYFQAAHGPDDDSGVMALPEQAPCPPFHPRRDLPARSGPWSTGGGEGDPGFPFHTEGWARYSLPRRIARGAWIGSQKMHSKHP
ncbi:Vps27, partial [Ophiophagus hannah]